MPINRSTVEHHIARERERGAFPVKTIATNPRHTLPPWIFRNFPAFPPESRASKPCASCHFALRTFHAVLRPGFPTCFLKIPTAKTITVDGCFVLELCFFFLLFSFFFRVVGLLGYSPRLFPCFSNVCSFVRFAWLIEICEDG